MTYQFPVSILMTAYNSEIYIKDAISSILGQSFGDFEFIILDDGSTDNTLEIIKQMASQDARIKVIENTTNLGIAPSRSKLVDLAQGKYIAWQDSDDVSLPDRIESLYNFMEANPEVGICGGYLQFFNQTGQTSIRKYALDDKTLRKNIFKYSPVAQPAAMVRTQAFKRFGAYKDNFSGTEDLYFSFTIGQEYKFANLPKILIKYREQDGSITFRKLKRLEIQTLQIRKIFWHNKNYQPALSDYLYNFLQLATLYLMPVKLRIYLFNYWRNSKV